MSQPVSGYQWRSVSASGTVVVSEKDTVLRSIFIAGTYVGTVKFHDTATAAGTSSTTPIITIGLPTTLFPAPFQRMDVQCKKGLVYEASGTPILTFTYGD